MVVIPVKCIVVGDSAVGKTALIQSFLSDGTAFSKIYNMTLGTEVCNKIFSLDNDNSKSVDFFIFDNASHDVFKDVTEVHWEKLGMYIIVFDVTNKKSFTSCQKWLKSLKQYCEPDKTIPGVLIGNKADLEQRRKVTTEEARIFAATNSLTYFESSAKEHTGVNDTFRHLSEKAFTLHQDDPNLVQLLEH
ncbi:intraflagellar transport protein 27 homolog [Clavelina lepadiformis]|uniref:intraflagellar transport protein 27 homolog n=1 Tax=Clavelina lepadiformis TaxID=159417 RepID=UPI00404356D6